MARTPEQNNAIITGNIPRQLLLFFFPIWLGTMFQQLYNTVDTLIVGNFVGTQALAAVGATSSFVQLLVGLFVGLCSGAGVIIAQSFGAGDHDEVNRQVHTALALAIAGGAALTVIGLLISRPVLRLMQTPDEIVGMASEYLQIYFLGMIPQMIYNMGTNILRAVGDSKRPLYFLIVASIVNIVLDIVLVAVIPLGVAGAAIATVASQVVSAVLCIIKLTRSDGPYRLEIKRIGFDLPLLKKITSQGVPSGVQNSIIAIANVVVQSNINTFGSDAMAGCGSYSKVEGFVFLPITAFAMALTTFIGQNLGAGQFDRAKQGARIGILCSMAMAELIGVALFFLAPYAMRLFNDDPAVVAIGVRQSHIEALFFCFLAFAHGVSAVLRGAGRAQVPMYTMLGCWCILRVSYITLALKVWPDIATIFWAYPITWSVSCVVFLLYYLKADWVHALEKSL